MRAHFGDSDHEDPTVKPELSSKPKATDTLVNIAEQLLAFRGEEKPTTGHSQTTPYNRFQSASTPRYDGFRAVFRSVHGEQIERRQKPAMRSLAGR